mgnify:CR=1 FL=1
MFLGAGGSAHAPSSYSLLADAFPPNRITRAFALLQLGFIGGTTIGIGLGGKLVMESANWGGHSLLGLPLHGWQWLLIGEGAAGILVALLLLMVREPRRRIPAAAAAAQGAAQGKGGLLTFMGLDALKAIHARGRVFYPLFAALALMRRPLDLPRRDWVPMLLLSLVGCLLVVVSCIRLGLRHRDRLDLGGDADGLVHLGDELRVTQAREVAHQEHGVEPALK